jgi:hypothetical protein
MSPLWGLKTEALNALICFVDFRSISFTLRPTVRPL